MTGSMPPSWKTEKRRERREAAASIIISKQMYNKQANVQ